ncbi:hypothetical protein D3C85_1168660 [compost metagenome]
MGGAGAVDVLADRHRTDEGDGADIRVGEQAVDHLAGAVQHLQHALGCAGLDKQLGQAVGGHGVLFRRLEDEAVAGGDGQGKHPQRNHRREVERGDADAYAQRLNPTGGVDIAGHVLHGLAHHQAGDIGRLFDHLDAAPDVALGVGQGLAGFLGEDFRQFVVVFLEQVLITQHQPGAIGHRHFAPGEEGGLGAGDGGLDLLGRGFRRQGQHLLGRRVGDFDEFAGAAFAPFTFDQLRDCLAHRALHFRSGTGPVVV